MRNLTYLVICAALATACREDPMMMGSQDLSASGDMAGGGGDMAMMRMYTNAKPHDIDKGTVTKNTAVRLTGMVATTNVTAFLRSGMDCMYQTYVQDPACTTPPCGLVVVAESSHKHMNVRDCPPSASSGSLLATVRLGDNVDVTGVVDVFAQAGQPTQHEVELDSAMVTGGNQVAMIFTETDASIFPNGMGSGAGWAKYEGTLVRVAPVGGLTVTQTFPAGSGGGTRPVFITNDNITWAYTFLFGQGADGGAYPSLNAQFKSITGVVNTLPIFGGQLVPRATGDFENP
jgi:hypothetical protein